MYGPAPFHSSLQRRLKHHALQQSATLSRNGFSRHTEWQPCIRVCTVCAHVFAFSREEQGDDLLWSQDVCWKHRQTKHVPNELTFLLWKHQFRLAVWNEPRRAPSPPPASQPVDRRHHLADCSLPLSLPLPLSDILTASSGYQDTAIPGPLSALTSYSSSRRPDGILGKYTAAFSVWNIVKID